MFFWDPTYIIIIPAIILSIYAQGKISTTYNKYSEVYSRAGYTGAQAARAILQANGLYDVRIEPVAGNLSDHYDPRDRTVRLSEGVYSGNSLASLAVAAHETGHAIQHANGYFPLQLRSTFVPVANFGSSLGPVLILIGFFMPAFNWLLQIGILAFSLAVIFQLITLPVEYNASHRAMALLQSNGMLAQDEVKGARRVLSAAALTYVAAALTAVLELARFILIAQGRNRND
ncbi:zinc metallopeptidase [Desulfitobacterium sp.]|uniref:zinc metallopeptidase n=1 Tax=Desulfitobacterium sp. TaxID=49981 RepID=UPI002B201308|nr:zinc metallopeptidase [Desulfitobacterium sp.]MEA4900126.1 zinc metallopeptidase [Desulfitobacterium sp.]